MPARRVRALLAAALLLPNVMGCYTYVPLTDGTQSSGIDVSLSLTDRGRVALSDDVGSGARRLTGRLVQNSDSVLVLAVSSVEYFDAPQPAKWSGEVVRVAREYVSGVSERRLSRTRSWLAAGAGVAVAFAVATVAIVGFGRDPGSSRPGPEPEPQN